MNNNQHILFRGSAKLIDLMLILVVWKLLPQAEIFIGILYLLIGDGLFKDCSIGDSERKRLGDYLAKTLVIEE